MRTAVPGLSSREVGDGWMPLARANHGGATGGDSYSHSQPQKNRVQQPLGTLAHRAQKPT